jgi:hypothetical protein
MWDYIEAEGTFKANLSAYRFSIVTLVVKEMPLYALGLETLRCKWESSNLQGPVMASTPLSCTV